MTFSYLKTVLIVLRRLGRFNNSSNFLRASHFQRHDAKCSQLVQANEYKNFDDTSHNGATYNDKAKLSLNDHMFHLCNYYNSKSRINPGELCSFINRLEEECKHKPSTLKHRDFKSLLFFCTTWKTPALRPSTLTELAERVWRMIPEFGLKYDDSLFNALINVYYANYEERKMAGELLEEVTKSSPRLLASTRNNLLKLACKEGDKEIMWNFYTQFRKDGSRIDLSSYNHFLYGFLKIKYLMKTMSRRRVTRASSTFAAVITGYAETDDVDHLSETLEEADNQNVLFEDNELLNCAFAIATNMESWETLTEKVFNKLRQWHLPQFTNLAQRLISVDRPHIAARIFIMALKQSMETDNSLDVGNFLIEQMFLIKSPIQSIFDVCEILQTSNVHRRPFLTALHCAYVNGTEDAVLKIFPRLGHFKYQVRPQYIIPLLVLRGKRGAPIQQFAVALKMWFESLPDEDKSDRLLDADFFGIWYWPCVENSRKIHRDEHCSAGLLSDLETTMHDLVKCWNGHGSVGCKPATSGDILTGFVHHCLRRNYDDLIRKSLTKYPESHINTNKLHVALARHYQRTKDAELIILVMRAGDGHVVSNAANGQVLKDLLNGVSLGNFVQLLEIMANSDLKLPANDSETILRYWSNSTNNSISNSTKDFMQRLRRNLQRMQGNTSMSESSIRRNHR